MFFVEWYNFDIILISNVTSVDSSISTINNVAIIPSLFVISGRGPCVIDQTDSILKTYIQLKFDSTAFYVQCAGPTLITISLPSSQSKKQQSEFYSSSDDNILWEIFNDKKNSSLKNKASNSSLRFAKFEEAATSTEAKTSLTNQKDVCLESKKQQNVLSTRKKGVRLYNYFDQKNVSDEIDCFEWCLSEIKCVASSFQQNSHDCYLFTNSFLVKHETGWTSLFKMFKGTFHFICNRRIFPICLDFLTFLT